MGISVGLDDSLLADGVCVLSGVDLRCRTGADPKSADPLWGLAVSEFPVVAHILWPAVVSGGVFCADRLVGADLPDYARFFRDRRKSWGSAAAVYSMGYLCGIPESWRIFFELGSVQMETIML